MSFIPPEFERLYKLLTLNIQQIVGILSAVKMQRTTVISHLWVLNNPSVLDVEPANFFQVSVVGPVGGEELRHDRHLLRRVDGEPRPAAEELVVVHAVGREVASVLVAHAVVPEQWNGRLNQTMLETVSPPI